MRSNSLNLKSKSNFIGVDRVHLGTHMNKDPNLIVDIFDMRYDKESLSDAISNTPV